MPYQLIKQELDLRATARMVEILDRGKRVATHRRCQQRGGHTTVAGHMPKSHQEYLEWTPPRLIGWAKETGRSTADLVTAIMSSRAHPQQGFRSCLGVMRLGKKHGAERLEAACRRALAIDGVSYKSVASILKHGLEDEPLPEASHAEPIDHANVRGAGYYCDGCLGMVPC